MSLSSSGLSPGRAAAVLGTGLGATATGLVAALTGAPEFVVVAALVLWVVSVGPVLGTGLLSIFGILTQQRLLGDAISVADVLTVIAGIVALSVATWRRVPGLRLLLAGFVAYGASLSLAIVAHPSLPSILEGLHRGAILTFSVLCGVVLARRGQTRLALYALIACSVVVALVAMQYASVSGEPAYPLGLHKNYAGSILVTALLAGFMLDPRSGWERRVLRVLQVLLFLGILAVRSRGAILGLGAGLLVLSFLFRRHRVLSLGAAIAGVVYVQLAVAAEQASNPIFGSSTTHLTIYGLAWNVWLSSPVVGRGLRFFYTGGTDLALDPHNVVLLTLAESGIVGFIGFAGMLGASTLALLKRHQRIATVAVAILLARLTHGLFDVYWVHGSQSIVWLTVGLALGAASLRDRADAPAL